MNISNSKTSLRYEYDYSPVQPTKRQSLIRTQSTMQIHSQSPGENIQRAEEHLQGTRPRHCILFTCIGILVVGVLVGVGVGTWYYLSSRNTYFETNEVLGNIQINAQTRSGNLFTTGNNDAQTVRLGEGTAAPLKYAGSCSLDDQKTVIKDPRYRYVCLQYAHESAQNADYRMVMQTVPAESSDSQLQCYDVRWDFPAKDSLRDCFYSKDAHVYGGGIRHFQTWPSDHQPLVNQTVVHDPTSLTGYVSLVAPYYVFTTGLAIFGNVSENLIVVNLNNPMVRDGEFCIGTTAKDVGQVQTFSYSMCLGNNITHVHKNFLKKLQAPVAPSFDEKIIRKPIWTTLSMAIDTEGRLSDDAVNSMADILIEQEFPVSQLLIDTRWESLPGEDSFNTETFPNPSGLFTSLQTRSIVGQLMFHPFVGARSPVYAGPGTHNLLSKDPATNQPLRANSWLGDVSQLDFTTDAAVAWKQARVKGLSSVHASSGCRMLGGTQGWISSCCGHTASKYWHNLHVAFPVAAKKICGDNVQLEISPGFTRQILRMADTPVLNMSVDESIKVQLRALIPKALTIGLLGHPIFIPVSVGGNPFMNEHGHLDVGPAAEFRYPTHDRFLRWLAVVLFMPVIEFSINPLYYADEPKVLDHTKALLKIREKNMEYLVSTARSSSQTGDPMIRPMWWNYPNDRKTWTIDDQYFVGDDLLIAPIVLPDTVTRTVYLPEGNWINPQGGREKAGTIDVVAALNEIPYYIRQR